MSQSELDIQKITYELNNTPLRGDRRDYLGLSGIGSKCYRKLQHDHYWTYETSISKRVQRIFDTGHKAEDFMIADLESMGLKVTGEQLEIIATAGHWKGHIDGMVIQGKESGLLEMKTHNDKSFKEVARSGVFKSKEGHYAQCQAYMGYLELQWALYMAYSKNTSEYYLEIIDFDSDYFDDLKRKEMEIIASDTLLPRVGTGKPTWFECKFCSANEVCYGYKNVNLNCRTCKFVDVIDNGEWRCNLHSKKLTTDDQSKACSSYELAEMFTE